MDKLVLIDGNSVLYRAYYSTPYLTSSDGTPTNAVFGFINMLLKLIGDVKPEYLLVAFDRKEPTYRHKMYAGYKALRKPMPEELVPQVPLIKQALAAMNIKTFEKAGLEADDIIGTMAKRHLAKTIIITGDKDSFQLVDDCVSVYFTRKGVSSIEEYNAQNFKEKTGIDPIQIIDLKACMGDASDNIPGIKGIGEKGALAFVQTYSTIENLYEHLDDLKGKTKEKVEAGRESAFMSKTLATIDTAADVPLTLDDVKFTMPLPEKARAFFLKLEFSQISKKNIYAEKSASDASADVGDENSETDEKIQVKREIIKKITTDVILRNDVEYAFYLGKNLHLFSGETEFEFLIKENFFDDGLMLEDALNFIKPLFTGNNKLVVFDKKTLAAKLESYGFSLTAPADDVMLMKYVADYTPREFTLIECAERAGLPADSPAYALFALREKYEKIMDEQNTRELYEKIELPLAEVLREMEKAGFKVDSAALDEASALYKKRIDALLAEIKNYAGCDFNVNSPKQLGEVLFEKMGLKHGKKTKNGYSTGADVLENIEDEHPIIPLILKYRQLQKLLSTYIDGFRPLIDKKTGLIHTVFNQAVTSTGRLSSKEPNLQNIPVRDDEGREIRKFFIPRAADRVLVSADYSQIELRLLAHYSGCEQLIKAFCNEEDVHALTASQVFGVPVSEVTPAQRRSAKAVNFGIIYGISEYGLAKNLKIPVKVAAEYISKYFETYPKVKEYMNANVEFAKAHGYVTTAFNRRRVIPEISSTNYNIRSFGERAAMNMPLQGTAADIIKIAMINVFNRLKEQSPDSVLILQVHDELIIDCKESEAAKVEKILAEEMQGAVSLSVPLTVSVSSGKNWFAAK